MGWGFHTAGRYEPGNFRFRPPIVGVVDSWKDVRTSDGALSFTGCAGNMYEPQPIGDRPAALRFSHRAGIFRSGRKSVSLGGCWSCRDAKGFVIRAWGPIFPGWRCLYALQPISDRSGGLGFPRRAERCRPGRIPDFRPRGVGVVDMWKNV